MKTKNFLSILSLYMMDKCANILIEKKEIHIDFIKDLFQRDDVDILYERTDYVDGKTKGILDDTNITRAYAIQDLMRSDFSLKKFKVGRTNLIKNVITFIADERWNKSNGWHGKLIWYEES